MEKQPRKLSSAVHMIGTLASAFFAVLTPAFLKSAITTSCLGVNSSFLLFALIPVVAWVLLRRYQAAMIVMFFWSGFYLFFTNDSFTTDKYEEIVFVNTRYLTLSAFAFAMGILLLVQRTLIRWRQERQKHRENIPLLDTKESLG